MRQAQRQGDVISDHRGFRAGVDDKMIRPPAIDQNLYAEMVGVIRPGGESGGVVISWIVCRRRSDLLSADLRRGAQAKGGGRAPHDIAA